MLRFRLFFFYALLTLAAASPCFAQYTNVYASHIEDASGNLLANGTITFTATNAAGVQIGFEIGGGGQAILRPVQATVTNGGFSVNLADVSAATPSYFCYAVTAIDNATGMQVLGGAQYACIQPTGANYDFDNYTSATTPILPAGSWTVDGNLGVDGNLSVTGNFTAGTFSATENITGNLTGNVYGGLVEAFGGFAARGTCEASENNNIGGMGFDFGAGRTLFCNQYGSGSGGYEWDAIGGNNPTGVEPAIATLTPAGNLSVNGSVTAPGGFIGPVTLAAGSVTNTDLQNSSIVIDGTTCTLGTSCSPGSGTTGPVIQKLIITSGICSTSGSETQCTMTLNWPSAFADANYAALCSTNVPTGTGSSPGLYGPYTQPLNASSFQLTLQSGSNAAGGANTVSRISCIGVD